jgi:hypothetical protein
MTGSPRDGFGIEAVWAVILSPREGLPCCVHRGEIGIGRERGCGWAPCRCGVVRRGSVVRKLMGENAIEREAAVVAVDPLRGMD